MVRLLLKSLVPIFEISTLSIIILPSVASINRKNERANVDLPLPVLPTIPTFSIGLIEKVKPFNTGSRSAAYLTCKLLTSIAP